MSQSFLNKNVASEKRLLWQKNQTWKKITGDQKNISSNISTCTILPFLKTLNLQAKVINQ